MSAIFSYPGSGGPPNPPAVLGGVDSLKNIFSHFFHYRQLQALMLWPVAISYTCTTFENHFFTQIKVNRHIFFSF